MSPITYLRLTPHPLSILPDHPSLDPSPTRPPLNEFLTAILTEAQTFVASIPDTFRRDRKLRRSPPATAPVHLSTRARSGEYWVCRKSVHKDAPVPGSASWEEFRAGLREHHSEHEMEYTPSVSAVKTLLEWPSAQELEQELDVVMITHTFHPTALIAPRSFIVLVVSTDRPARGFVTVQIPLTVAPAGSDLDSWRNTISASAPRNTIFASYASVEQVLATPDGLEWMVATTSDAGGAIPQWIQRSWTMGGVPKAVVADVGLFLGWTARNRSRSRP
ncbi:hypothetical protein BO70DRAFT_390154 [Aspergillus heteromorphus CBS 117.55]|uniref:DUF3074 domain-containing protein n=1 Tax=Aspergillus heteromorphus CBS 117.55 TaxID=1448321 RepID=A0A317V8G3_9EURO|nr:uncharacterized protein BO70DRAFT_390154 [Aspergillus heteromorphus CBS 117.55]PWY69591.1 hypothetical protein BO70DRAFT_390154 [Aspergillus heteromorphus CBS 117.55]